MQEYIVDATGLQKTYDTGLVSVAALRGVDLHVKRGEMVAIMGPSGCGKTTLLNCLSGLDEIDSGQVLIDGTVLHDLPDDARSDYRARSMGFVFQLYNLLPVLSAVENVEMPLLVSGVNAAQAPPAVYGPARTSGPVGTGQSPARGAFRGAAATGDHRSGVGQRAVHCLGRRAHRRPGQRDRQ